MSIIDSIIKWISLNPKIAICWLIVVTLGILAEIYYPKIIGFMGEFWLKLELKKLPNKKYLLLNDIMIEDENGTHQIDHILISKYGIFVIEMKNYSGLIKGNSYSNKWSQNIGRYKKYFYNPIHQNYGHIKALIPLLNLEENNFVSVICFSNRARLRIKSNVPIVKIETINRKILTYKK